MHHHNYRTVNNDIIGIQFYMWWIQTYITIIIKYIILSTGALQYIHGWMDWRGYAITNNNTTLHEKYATHIPQQMHSYIIYYIHGNTIINILILQIVCILHKSHHCIIYELGGNILPPTSVKQYTTITRDLAISHLASQQLLYDV